MSRKYAQLKKTTLSYSISDSETSFRLEELLKLDGTSISASDIGDYMTFTFDPGTSKEEICSIASSGVTVNADGTIDLTGVVRGLKEIDPYTTGGYASDHGAGAVVVFSNNPQLYNQLANKSNDNTFTGLNIFNGFAPQTDTDPVAGNDLTRLSFVQTLVLGTLTTINVIVPGNAGETVVAGNLVYFDDTDNEWKKCDADTAATVNNVLLGIAQGAGTNGNTILNGVLLQGVDDNQSGLTLGDVYYASNTAGGIANTPGTTEVVVGIGKSATELYFAPRFNQQITEDQQDALAGTSGTPSATNKYVTNDDTTGTGSIIRTSAATPVTDIQTFSTAGSTSWNKPTGAKWVEVTVIGGGGGGGGGVAAQTAGGGGGGYGVKRFNASALASTETVVVGAGGASNASGGASSFGTTVLLRATGGTGSSTSTTNAGGTANGDIHYTGGVGGQGNGGGSGLSGIDTAVDPSPRGGGAGGYSPGSPTSATAGGAGGAFITNYVKAGGAGGASGVNNGVAAGATNTGLIYGGVGGGGAGYNGTGSDTGGTGGAGNIGSGGGGGRTAGGAGGDGMVVVTTYF